jgi:hypothetical protein
MKRSLQAIASLTAVLFVAGVEGCSDTPSVDTSRKEVTVTGVVKVKGKPAAGGQISYNPSNRDRKVAAFSAPIGSDGSYKIKTYTGENEVRFAGDVDKANPSVGMVKKFCVVSGDGHQQDFDLLADDQSGGESPKTKMMLKATGKSGTGGGARSGRGGR